MPYPRQGGSNTFPITYAYSVATVAWQENNDTMPIWVQQPHATPSYASLQITGPSTQLGVHIGIAGTVNCTITKSNISGPFGGGYVDVTLDGVQYEIFPNRQVVIPKVIKDILAASNDFGVV